MTTDPSRFGWFPPNVVSVQAFDREQMDTISLSSPVPDIHKERSC
jgi:hypothetical protein